MKAKARKIDPARKRKEWYFPFLGLVGTSSGMIYAFMQQQNGKAVDVISGIFFALVIAAILTSMSLLYFHFRGAH